MNRTEMIDALGERFGYSRREANEVVNAIFHPSEGMIAKSLRKGEKVSLTGFGTFDVRKRAAGMRRNPQTGESFKSAASKRPAFKAGASLKAIVNGKSGATAKGGAKSAAKGAAKGGAAKGGAKSAAKGARKAAR